jgi:hypothetical protein
MSQLQNHTRGRRGGRRQECNVQTEGGMILVIFNLFIVHDQIAETEGGMILVIFNLFIVHDQIAYTTNAILNSLLKGYKLSV